ncbi:lysozyme inhibitor LprI family protein [Roseovarius aestuariivivens]|uniref:lysozyme inhibitor LprI family protein n=1 Tax=Roseovarius aestuariivivens TaxID=1888910 RepID=UPI00107FFD66|nr:hypothetical protein [Roseovarius aestuariivivens]
MRNLVLGISLAVFTIFHESDALAEGGPSFDCAKASTATERTICDDPYSMLMDWEIARQFGVLRSMHPGIVAEQVRWLKQRDRCQDDRACLWSVLSGRWVALGHRIEEDLGIPKLSGVYNYVIRPNEITGDLTLAAGPGGNYGFFISTVTLRRGHLCEIIAANASRGDTGDVSWRIPQTDRALTLTPSEDGVVTLEIEYDDERSFCGASAYLHGPYQLTVEGDN